jgi:subtilisin family serine protease
MTVNVAAVDLMISGADFTNYGYGSNISAPGKDIMSSVPMNDYDLSSGTSMAAPIVAGTIALMKSLNQDITVSEVLDILTRSGDYVSEEIPPMIQVDDALIGQTTGKFPEKSRKQPPVAKKPDNSDILPAPSPVPTPVPSPDNGRGDDGTDYDAIRKLIESYKKKINDLEKLLPENQ